MDEPDLGWDWKLELAGHPGCPTTAADSDLLPCPATAPAQHEVERMIAAAAISEAWDAADWAAAEQAKVTRQLADPGWEAGQ
jgi:hypothetical protein